MKTFIITIFNICISKSIRNIQNIYVLVKYLRPSFQIHMKSCICFQRHFCIFFFCHSSVVLSVCCYRQQTAINFVKNYKLFSTQQKILKWLNMTNSLWCISNGIKILMSNSKINTTKKNTTKKNRNKSRNLKNPGKIIKQL